VLYKLNPDKTTEATDLNGYVEFLKSEHGLEVKRIALTDILPRLTVSTVFLGIDHGYNKKHAPILFETMVFSSGEATETHRYTTYQDALDGHNCVVFRIRKYLDEQTKSG
jgi:hypothetical protein